MQEKQWSILSCLDQEEELGPGWIVFKTAICNVKCRLTTMASKINRVYLVNILDLI